MTTIDGGLRMRAAGPSDRRAVLALRARCFPGEDLEKEDPAFLDWQLQSVPAGAGESFIAQYDGQPVAHFALIPQKYVLRGSPVLAALAVDAMTDPAWRGRGVYSKLVDFALREARGAYQFTVAWQIRDAVLPAMVRNGYVPTLRAPVMVRPLSLRALAHRFLKAAQPDKREVAVLPLVESLTADDAEAMSDVVSHFAPSGRAFQERSAEYLRWRYFSNPAWRYEVFGFRRANNLLAFCVSRKTTLRGFSTLTLVDFAWRDGHRRAARAVLSAALRAGAADGIELGAALVTTAHPGFPLLLSLGFLPGPHRFRFLVRPSDPTTETNLRDVRWALLWGDTDHL